MTPEPSAPYVVLRACGKGARGGESLNAGIILFAPTGALVALTQDLGRLTALHPDFRAARLDGWAEAVRKSLVQYAQHLPEITQQIAMLPLLVPPFVADVAPGLTALDEENPHRTLADLMAWLVDTPRRTMTVQRVPAVKVSRLQGEIRNWLRASKAFSTKVDDIGRGKVVANYPINPGADLYADFAVLNGKLNAIEALDLRGVERLTPTMRGDAALKGITLDEAREKIDGKRLVVISASDYAVARPAINLVSRYADEVLDMQTPADRLRLADFISTALHRPQLPTLDLQH